MAEDNSSLIHLITANTSSSLRISNITLQDKESSLEIRVNAPLYIEPYTYRLTNRHPRTNCTTMEQQSWTTRDQERVTLNRQGLFQVLPPQSKKQLSQHPFMIMWQEAQQWDQIPEDLKAELLSSWFPAHNTSAPPTTSGGGHPYSSLWWQAILVTLAILPICFIWCLCFWGRAKWQQQNWTIRTTRMKSCCSSSPNPSSHQPEPNNVTMEMLCHPPPSLQIIVRPPELPSRPERLPSVQLTTFSPIHHTPRNRTPPIYDVPRNINIQHSTPPSSGADTASTWSSSPNAELQRWLQQLPPPSPWRNTSKHTNPTLDTNKTLDDKEA